MAVPTAGGTRHGHTTTRTCRVPGTADRPTRCGEDGAAAAPVEPWHAAAAPARAAAEWERHAHEGWRNHVRGQELLCHMTRCPDHQIFGISKRTLGLEP